MIMIDDDDSFTYYNFDNNDNVDDDNDVNSDVMMKTHFRWCRLQWWRYDDYFFDNDANGLDNYDYVT